MNKKKIIAIVVILALLLSAGFVFYFTRNGNQSTYTFVAAKTANIKESVKTAGTTKAAEEVALAFEKTGKINKVNVKVGDAVKQGQVLAQLTDTDAAAQVNQAQAAYLAQAAILEQLKNGATQADLNVTNTKIDNAQKTIADAQLNLDNTTAKAETDLNNLYEKAKDIINDAGLKSNDAIVNNANNFFDNILSGSPRYKYYTYYTVKQSGVEQQFASVYLMNSEIKTIADSLGDNQASIDAALVSVEQKLQAELNFLRDLSDLIEQTNNIDVNKASFKASVGLSANSINAAITAIKSSQQAIITQKAANKNLITAAQTQLNQANSGLALANSELNFKKAGATPEQIMAQEAVVRQSLASVQNYQAQLAKSTIISPIEGVISKQDGNVGEIAMANTPIISILSNAKYQVEAQIPEAEVSKIKVGQSAEVTLDAYGDSKKFAARVISIDLTSTLVSGQPTYKTTLEFTNDDQEIKSGLSANIKIAIDEKQNVLTVPQSSIFTDGKYSFVIIDNGTKTGEKRQVVLGVVGDNDQVEILSGLSGNEQIAYFGDNN